jgi:hypothetical protein
MKSTCSVPAALTVMAGTRSLCTPVCLRSIVAVVRMPVALAAWRPVNITGALTAHMPAAPFVHHVGATDETHHDSA